MTFVKVHGDVPGNGSFAFAQRVQVTVAQLGRHLVTNVKQLSQVRVVGGIFRLVPKRVGKLLRTPTLDRFDTRQLRPVNINHRSVGGAKLVHVLQSARVNLFRQRQSFGVAFSQTDQFLEP